MSKYLPPVKKKTPFTRLGINPLTIDHLVFEFVEKTESSQITLDSLRSEKTVIPGDSTKYQELLEFKLSYVPYPNLFTDYAQVKFGETVNLTFDGETHIGLIESWEVKKEKTGASIDFSFISLYITTPVNNPLPRVLTR